MVREAIARQTRPAEPNPEQAFRANVAFTRFPLSRGGDGDGACLIEPAVRCSHCGYCQSFGH